MFSIAVIPSILLLIYIYKKDKKEKEPIKLLLKCFFFGSLCAIPSIIVEMLGTELLDAFVTSSTLFYVIIDNFIITALSEEFFKFRALKRHTFISQHFDCMYDGIVYSVFTSLGFATIENIMYVFEYGFSTGILRMFTSIPGHASFAVYMGYYYSKAKQADGNCNKKSRKKYLRLALLIPVILHGIYDSLICIEENMVGETLFIISMLLWICFTIAMFIVTFIFVNIASKNDAYILTGYSPSWKCKCGAENHSNFCTECGTRRP